MRSIHHLLCLLLLAIFFAACKPTTPPTPPPGPAPDANAVAKQLVEQYKNGQVTRCNTEKGVIYFGARNAPDAGAEIYDATGKKIGTCYFNTGQVDPLCESRDCKDIYRVNPNIWGQPGIEFQPE